jgi:hypothetical protein
VTSKEEKKHKDPLKKLVDYHPEFLETIKEVYPLAVLGSLCIAISAFTAESYPEAQTYALTAASLFLFAFASSFGVKILSNELLAFTSYASTALGIIMLFAVVFQTHFSIWHD